MPLLHPPMNFAAVEPNIYRSAYPTIHNIAFLHSLGIRTVALLSIEPLPPAVLHAVTLVHTREAKNNTLHGPSPPADRHPHTPTTDHATRIRVVEAATFSSWLTDSTNGGDDFSQSDVQWAMDLAVNAHWHPILFACPTGELQTSVVIGCLRRYQSWSLTSIFGECELFTNYSRQLRSTVMQFIEAWRPSEHPISETDLIYRHSVWVAKQRQSRTSKPSHHQPHPPHTNHAMSSSSDEEGIVEGEEDQNEEDLFQIGEATPDKLATAAMNAMAEQQHWPAHDTQRSSGDGRAQAAMQESVVDGPPLPHHRERPHSSGSHPTKRRIIVAEWYTQAIRTRKELELLKDPLPCGSTPAAQLPAPHERYAAVRNPPALDERSTFMKESIVEEDDD